MGAIKFADNLIRFYEYNGTSDIVISRHYESMDEVSENWRDHTEETCSCGREEAVSLYTNYGGGFYIEGIACRHCNSVRSKDFDFEILERDEVEDWVKDLEWE